MKGLTSEEYKNSPACWEKTPAKLKETLIDWIDRNITPRKTANYNHTSYGLKHIFESATGLYCTNGEFKGAMRECGYEAVNEKELNWCYYISEKSPAMKCRK